MLQESGIVRQTRRSILSLEAIHLRQRVHAALLVILIHPTRTRKPVRHGQPELESAPVRQNDVKQALRDRGHYRRSVDGSDVFRSRKDLV